MPCEIHERTGYFEIRVSAPAGKFDVLKAVAELDLRDHGKRLCDLWVFSPDVALSYADFSVTADSIRRMCPPGMKGNRCAIVAGGVFQQAQLELYRAEASVLPFEMRVFGDEAEAILWLKREDGKPPAGSAGVQR